jgi:hypothetical protein
METGNMSITDRGGYIGSTKPECGDKGGNGASHPGDKSRTSYVQGFEAELSELTKVDVKPVTIKPCDNRCCITLFARLKDPYNIPKKLKLEISLAAPIERRVLHTLARYSSTSRRCWIGGPVLIIETSPAFHILKRKKKLL